MRSSEAGTLRKFSPVLFPKVTAMRLALIQLSLNIPSVLQAFKDLFHGQKDGLGHLFAVLERSRLDAEDIGVLELVEADAVSDQG